MLSLTMKKKLSVCPLDKTEWFLWESNESHWPDSHRALRLRVLAQTTWCFMLFSIHSKPRIEVLWDILVSSHTLKHISFHKCVFLLLNQFFNLLLCEHHHILPGLLRCSWHIVLRLLGSNSFSECEVYWKYHYHYITKCTVGFSGYC